ncbi:MAG TPA: agmatinase [Solirubrobacterales bacterium]|nr:agmatinase [Solirubrobacterales bacterium]
MTGEEPSPGSSPPRFAGIRTFARQPHTDRPERADVAVVGVPFDGGASFRPGARFGPEAIRSASVLLRPYDPAIGRDVLNALEIVDAGDVAPMPGATERAIEQIAEGLAPLVDSGAVTLALGGDHTIALAELRVLAARHGPPALVLLDAHADTWDVYGEERYFHGTPFRRAVEEGVVDPGRSVIAGMRGSLYSEDDLAGAQELGFDLIRGSELRALGQGRYAERVRERVGDVPAFLSFDVDFVDPGFAPATGTPEPGGPSSAEALELVRSLTGIRFIGFDVVEVSPPYDPPGQPTALLAANVAYAMLGLVARSRT